MPGCRCQVRSRGWFSRSRRGCSLSQCLKGCCAEAGGRWCCSPAALACPLQSLAVALAHRRPHRPGSGPAMHAAQPSLFALAGITQAVSRSTHLQLHTGLFLEQGPAVFEHQMRVNYLGTVNTIQAALPGMLQRRRGRVVLVSSGLAIVGFAGGAGGPRRHGPGLAAWVRCSSGAVAMPGLSVGGGRCRRWRRALLQEHDGDRRGCTNVLKHSRPFHAAVRGTGPHPSAIPATPCQLRPPGCRTRPRPSAPPCLQATAHTPPPSGRCAAWPTACATSCWARGWRSASRTRQTWVRGGERGPAAVRVRGARLCCLGCAVCAWKRRVHVQGHGCQHRHQRSPPKPLQLGSWACNQPNQPSTHTATAYA